MKFEDFKLGQQFNAAFTLAESDFYNYIFTYASSEKQAFRN